MSNTTHSASITQTRFDRFLAYRLQNEAMAVTVVPALGGKIVSVTTGLRQREWLWRNNRICHRKAVPADCYTRLHDTGGVDECFPSVDACELPSDAGVFAGLTLPDHGELYGRPWTQVRCTEHADGSVSLILKQKCSTLPVTFQRSLTLPPDQGCIKFQYSVRNLCDTAVPFSWCLHPALAITPGMELVLPNNHQLHCSFASEHAPLVTGDTFYWPNTPGGSNLSVIPEVAPENGFAAKLLSVNDLFDCTNPGAKARIGIMDPATGEALYFDLAPEEVPHLALWLNYGGWAGDGGTPYFNLVLEPAIGNADSLRELIDRNTAPILAPGSSRQWSFQICTDNAPLC
ncbi:hypothetical protein [uncultured Microbulbifer sp.]|uniref:hypothetical protein n=1 Tax=uncultured Microbulbifer sp. TaxID=348147 RepID=UPI002607504B|nr:hypothetical protein [uncultured Microbulbifer sp.]